MKLLIDEPLMLEGSIEDELNEASGANERNYYLSGVFSSPDTKNRNGRVYSRAIWEKEVKAYQTEIVNKTVNSLGEWQHPPRSNVDPMKAVIRIVEMGFKEDGQVWGKCKILNNNSEATNAIKGLIKEGIKIGISTRGVGKVSATGVVEEYKMITADLVDMPSNYGSELNGVVEGVQFLNGIAQDKEYQIDENGCIGEACSLASTQIAEANESNKPCPIQEKITEAVTKAKEEIYDNIDAYLQESFKEIETERVQLIEGISDFLNSKPVNEKALKIKDVEKALKAGKIVNATYNNGIWCSIQDLENGTVYVMDQNDDEKELEFSKLLDVEIVESKKKKDNFADKLLEALRAKEERSKDGAKKDEDNKDSTVGKCAECGKEVEEDEKFCKACLDKEEIVESDLMARLKNKVFNNQ